MSDREDKELVKRCVKGDQKAFEALVDKYQKTVFNIIYRLIHNYDESEDLTQKVFIKVYENLDAFNSRYKFFSWLYRIAVNESLNHIKAKKRLTPLEEGYAASEKRPDETFNGKEVSERLQNAINQLNANYRTVIILKHFQNCSYSEIADIVDIPEKTVKSRLFTARQLLKDILIKEGITGHD
ncbi:MAG TPA: sigma-70 family RNA polymerase sigma factor [Caldithrix abyssi]|uniref:RNA polymerase sigma factor n=1 Tax=Caldithrix abyssi TaxID=187145 RepID=A0A7V4U291_CALAY|nr:sigma-70 family RNA polymerase sigma factor [Caldithrix abyssi]